MSRPYPEGILVCAICGQPWDKHIRVAYWRLSINEDDQMPTEQEVEEAVSYLDCIHLLTVANQGPPGPPGPVGMAGPQGKSA